MIGLLIELWRQVNTRRRFQLGAVAILMIMAAFAEIITIGAVIPFLTVLAAPDKVFDQVIVLTVLDILNISRPDQLAALFAAAFAIAAILSGITRLSLLWLQTRVGHAIGVDLSSDIYRRTLYQPYAVHIARNSSEVISGVLNKAHAIVGQTVLPLLTFASTVLMLVSIFIAVIAINPAVALSAFLGFGAVYALVVLVTRKRLSVSGELISYEQSRVLKNLNEGLGSIRDVLIDRAQESYLKSYRAADLPLRKAVADIQIISSSPRFVIEAVGLVLISALSYVLTNKADGLTSAVPTLGAIALGAQRMLPMLQQAYASWATMTGGKASLQDALDLLNQPLPEYAIPPKPDPLHFAREIRITDLSFRYSIDRTLVLRDINLVIPHGSKVGFIGATGSGKSTLIDILMGLLQPTSGNLSIDGVVVNPENARAWQAHIAHVPQSIFLADLTIAENIAFGIPREEIDLARVRCAAAQAQIAETIEKWPHNYETVVGERGIKLSGGQRQRIGIARALYKKSNVIVLDEATSALDNDTEDQVMDAIACLGDHVTVVMIAHRFTSLKACTRVVRLEDGQIRSIGTFDEITRLLL